MFDVGKQTTTASKGIGFIHSEKFLDVIKGRKTIRYM